MHRRYPFNWDSDSVAATAVCEFRNETPVDNQREVWAIITCVSVP